MIVEGLQPACSAIKVVSDLPALIPVGDSLVIISTFMTHNNVNLARHIMHKRSDNALIRSAERMNPYYVDGQSPDDIE